MIYPHRRRRAGINDNGDVIH